MQRTWSAPPRMEKTQRLRASPSRSYRDGVTAARRGATAADAARARPALVPRAKALDEPRPTRGSARPASQMSCPLGGGPVLVAAAAAQTASYRRRTSARSASSGIDSSLARRIIVACSSSTSRCCAEVEDLGTWQPAQSGADQASRLTSHHHTVPGAHELSSPVGGLHAMRRRRLALIHATMPIGAV